MHLFPVLGGERLGVGNLPAKRRSGIGTELNHDRSIHEQLEQGDPDPLQILEPEVRHTVADAESEPRPDDRPRSRAGSVSHRTRRRDGGGLRQSRRGCRQRSVGGRDRRLCRCPHCRRLDARIRPIDLRRAPSPRACGCQDRQQERPRAAESLRPAGQPAIEGTMPLVYHLLSVIASRSWPTRRTVCRILSRLFPPRPPRTSSWWVHPPGHRFQMVP